MRRLIGLALVTSTALGCNGGLSASQAASQAIRLAVDADRDGTVRVGAAEPDVLHRGEWSAAFGAVFLANLDDDDGKHRPDATDQVVNGDADALDLARVVVVTWSGVPSGALATLAPDAAAAPFVHLFRHASDGSWQFWDPTSSQLTDADLRLGAEFGVEATDFANPTWDGALTLTYSVTDGHGQPIGADTARLQVAPLLLQSNLAAPDRAYVTSFTGDPMIGAQSDAFVAGLATDASAVPVPLVQVDGSAYPDQWTQDLFEVGWSGLPSTSGVHAMYVVLRTPPPTRTAADQTSEVMLAPDFGWVWKHSEPYNRNAEEGSLDSFGNLDAIPPYSNGASHFPFGRVLIGSTPARHMDDALRDFLNAQKIQEPSFYLDTAWLFVGHVDEVLSFVRASTPRGWKLLLASPARARQLLTDLVTQNAANGDVKLFADVQQFDAMQNLFSGGVAVKTVLADAALMTANQLVQTKIDAIRAALQSEIGLADSEIVDVPVLFANVGGGYLAYTAGVVNLLHLDGRVAPPKTHGPIIAGKDVFAADFESQMAPLGLQVSWVEDWTLYHLSEGEVHCGTNVTRKVPDDFRFWEVMR